MVRMMVGIMIVRTMIMHSSEDEIIDSNKDKGWHGNDNSN
jgi:hypothetical protein